MERRYRVRLDELLDDAEVRLGGLRGVMPRLESFLQPFVEALDTPEQKAAAVARAKERATFLGGSLDVKVSRGRASAIINSARMSHRKADNIAPMRVRETLTIPRTSCTDE